MVKIKKTQLKIISEYKILIDRDRNIDFIVDSNDDFKSYGVALFMISISRMYGKNNFLIANKDYIDYLTNLVLNQDYKIINDDGINVSYDFCWQYEIFVDFLLDSVYIEKWGLCAKIKIKDLLEVFNEIQFFLSRWNSKEVLTNQIRSAFRLKDSEEARRLFYIKTKSKINSDQIQIALSENDFEMNVNEYIKSLNFPVHMT